MHANEQQHENSHGVSVEGVSFTTEQFWMSYGGFVKDFMEKTLESVDCQEGKG